MKLDSTRDLLVQAERVLAQELAPIKVYLDDPAVQEVMINRPDRVFIERNGQFERLELTISEDKLVSAITTLSNVNRKGVTPVLDCRLPGLRIAATLPPVAVQGPAMSIRRHSARAFTLDDYVASGAFSRSGGADAHEEPLKALAGEAAAGGDALKAFFEAMIRARINFIVSGSTSSGKTAFLNALARLIPADTRVLTIEDTAELTMHVDNWLAFEANPVFGIDVRSLVRHALRNRPNRIWVGEGRGAEFYDILDAYNTGHPGSAVSFHSDSAAMALPRLENMIRMAPEASNWPLADLRRQIAATFKFVIHCTHQGGRRGPSEVMAIDGCTDTGYLTRTVFRR